MADLEIIKLGEFDPEANHRVFDAVSYGRFYWRGLLSFVRFAPTDTRICVFSNRDDAFGDDYAVRPGSLEEVADDTLAASVIAKAVTECFDHTRTVEALSDGNGGWITLETDT